MHNQFLTQLYVCAIVGASTIAIRPLQDFQAKIGGGRFDDNYMYVT